MLRRPELRALEQDLAVVKQGLRSHLVRRELGRRDEVVRHGALEGLYKGC